MFYCYSDSRFQSSCPLFSGRISRVTQRSARGNACGGRYRNGRSARPSSRGPLHGATPRANRFSTVLPSRERRPRRTIVNSVDLTLFAPAATSMSRNHETLDSVFLAYSAELGKRQNIKIVKPPIIANIP